VLDVGCGTGRAIVALRQSNPDVTICGCDLSTDLLREAVRKGRPEVQCANSYRLPYRDGAFDLVIETGVLHHVAKPELMIREMLRVSRFGIAISDSNMYADANPLGIFGMGIVGAGIWMMVCRSGLWKLIKRAVMGHTHSYSSGDGIFYVYSVFDALKQLSENCHEIYVVPLAGNARRNSIPLLAATHCLVVAMKMREARA
jgi:SAM-dependent methyltransferase